MRYVDNRSYFKRYSASELKMEIETESEQTNEPFLNVGEENIEESEQRSEQLVIEALGDEGEDILFQDDVTAEDPNNFNVSVALMEI